ncbi:MAG: hypothetical protein H0W42_00180 [Gemmatimonadaceae bacterium]|nr:hypothetical protein [Gemmatimonadaceae bacterium]
MHRCLAEGGRDRPGRAGDPEQRVELHRRLARDTRVTEAARVRSGAQVLKFVTDRKPTHAGIDPYNYYIDRISADNVRVIVSPE